jgi:hypothetical protein
MTRLVQLEHPGFGRRVALVHGGDLHLLGTYRSVYAFANAALEIGSSLRDLLSTDLTGIALNYAAVHALESEWRFAPAFDCAEVPARCLVTGCGRTYGPPPAAGDSGPTLFYKGSSACLRAHGDSLEIPAFATAGGEEAELAAVYLIDAQGIPRRLGFAQGNEFADPAMSAADPGAVSHAKLRTCSLGPELALDGAFEDVCGQVRIERAGALLFHQQFRAGLSHMHYSLEQIEQSLFRHAAHREPGSAIVHFLGAPVGSFDGGVLQDGDVVTVAFEAFERPLVNRVQRAAGWPVHVLPV